jgi:hypothetical protein
MSVLALFISVAIVLAIALSMDGVIPRWPLEKLTNFPFKGCPATNGTALGFALFTVAILSYQLLRAWGQ